MGRPVLSLTLLGAFAVRLGPGLPLTVTGKKAQGLLAFLAMHAGKPQSRDKVMSLLWGDSPDRQARLSLRQGIFQIRRAFGAAAESCLVLERDTVELDPAAIDVDAREFERLARTGTPGALAKAAELYQGELLDGLIVDEQPYEEWLMSERQRLHELAVDVFARLLRQEMEARHDDRATQLALRLLALDPLQEPVHRALMRLYDRQGRRATSLRQYQECVDLLQRELGTEPEVETRQLYAEILRRHHIVTSERPAPPIAGGVPRATSGSGSVFVGRARELDRILASLPAAEDERGQVVLVLGEAGIGKTRFIEEVGAETERHGRHVVFVGCHQTEQMLPLRPFVDALRLAGIPARRDLLDALTPALRAELSRLLPELVEPGLVLPAEVQNPVRMFEAMAQVLGALAAARPLALAIEDLQWADDMTLRFLGFLGRRLARVPLVLLLTARDDELEDAPTLRLLIDEVEREGLGTRSVLRPLSRTDTAALFGVLARGRRGDRWADDAVADVWETSQGNPFVIVESVRTLLDRGTRARTGQPSLPDRVRELTARRIARLSEAARHLVAVAAVTGEPVPFGFLATAAAMEERAAADVVEELVRRRVLEIADGGVDFIHHRVRRVAYESLLPARRESLHAAVAQVFEMSNSDRLEEVSDRLAHHYGAARNAERAMRYLVLFAQTARTRYALDDALSALDQAMLHVPALPEAQRERAAIEIVLEKGFVLSLMVRPRDIVALLSAHRERVDALGDPRLSGQFYFRLGLTQFYLGDMDAVERAARRALAEALRSSDRLVSGLAHYVLSIRGAAVAPPEGLEAGRRAVEDLDAARAPFWLGWGRYALGSNLVWAGQFEAAREQLNAATDSARALHDVRLESLALGWLASVESVVGMSEVARAMADRAVAMAPDAYARANVTVRRGAVALERGDHEAARRDLEGTLEDIERRGIPTSVSRVASLLADAQQQRGQRDAARGMAEDALRHAAKVGARWDEAWARRVLARVALADGDLATAEGGFRAALSAFAAAGGAFEVARTRLALAEVVHAQGNATESARLLGEAGEGFRSLRVPGWLERAEKTAAQLGLSAPR